MYELLGLLFICEKRKVLTLSKTADKNKIASRLIQELFNFKIHQ
jgi:hypothetical protein